MTESFGDKLDAPKDLAALRRKILFWYDRHSRSLPWRGTTDPYRIWVSETMLQQTTTKTVEGYYDRFLQSFPTIADLAAAELDQVNRLWEGLGYYRRAAQLHRAAKEIVDRFDGVFPRRYEDVLSLPGVGRYTAGAILSIAFDQRLPILEANTLRLHARLTALKADPTRDEGNARLWRFAEHILPRKHIGHFNQALMDLGSRICTPKNPNCETCSIFSFCECARLGLQDRIPYPKEKIKKEDRVETAVIIRKKGKILMVRYPQGVRWAGLWDFPRVEAEVSGPLELAGNSMLRQRLAAITGRRLEIGKLIATKKHAVTRFRITLHFVEGRDKGPTGKDSTEGLFETRWVTTDELRHLPLNSTARQFSSNLY